MIWNAFAVIGIATVAAVIAGAVYVYVQLRRIAIGLDLTIEQ